MTANKLFGAHIYLTNDMTNNIFFDKCLEVKKNGGNLIQILIYKKNNFLKFKQIKEWLIKQNIKIVIHGSYLINISQQLDEYSPQLINFIDEIKSAHDIGAFGIVIHLGKQMGLNEKIAMNNMYANLLHIHNQTKQYSHVKIFIEMVAGQGTEMCSKIEDLAYFYKKISVNSNTEIKNRFKICLDTCHIFAAGYDITNQTKIKLFLEAFEELIGIKNIGLIHLNDSKKELGSHVDRHADIGTGFIGFNNLLIIFKYFLNINVPIVLETNKYIKDLHDLHQLVRKI